MCIYSELTRIFIYVEALFYFRQSKMATEYYIYICNLKLFQGMYKWDQVFSKGLLKVIAKFSRFQRLK